MLQVQDLRDRFWVQALYDARGEEFSKLGKQYGTKPGQLSGGRAKLEERSDVHYLEKFF
ncbi:TPA: hypothetical protein SAN82_003615 [Pseudomonas putida]|nr:hypothetical protein [Pseudomonas putida]